MNSFLWLVAAGVAFYFGGWIVGCLVLVAWTADVAIRASRRQAIQTEQHRAEIEDLRSELDDLRAERDTGLDDEYESD